MRFWFDIHMAYGFAFGKIAFQSSFMLTTVQPCGVGFIKRLVEFADV